MSHEFDPHDPHGKLQVIVDEFAAYPEHGEPPTSWRPGDSLLGDATISESMKYFVWQTAQRQAAEKVEQRNLLAEGAEFKRALRKRRLGRFLATAALVAVGWGIASPGGAIDKIGAAHTKSAEVAASVQVDSQYEAAKQRIVETYELIDSQGIEAVLQRADTIRAERPEQFASESEITLAHQRIDEAAGGEQLQHASMDFLGTYGIKGVTISQYVNLGDARNMTHAIVNVLAPLPRDFITQQTKFSQLSLLPPDIATGAVERGGTMSSIGKMTLYEKSSLVKAAGLVNGVLAQPDSYEHIVAHELAHAWQNKQGVNKDHYPTDIADGPGPIISDIARNAIGRPDMPSGYAREKGGKEYGAEVIAGLLTNDVTSLPSPDHWRAFGSYLTQQHLEQLAELDSSYRGLATLLIADRSR